MPSELRKTALLKKIMTIASAFLLLVFGVVLFALPFSRERYIAAGGCLLMALCLALPFLFGIKDKNLEARAAPFLKHCGVLLFAVVVLGCYSSQYEDSESFLFVTSMFIASFGLVIAFFRENEWADDCSFGWLILRNVPYFLIGLYLLLMPALISYDHGFQGAYSLAPYVLGTAYVSYILALFLKGRYPKVSYVLECLYIVLLGLCPIAFIFF